MEYVKNMGPPTTVTVTKVSQDTTVNKVRAVYDRLILQFSVLNLSLIFSDYNPPTLQPTMQLAQFLFFQHVPAI